MRGFAGWSEKTLSNSLEFIIENLSTTRRSGKQAVSIGADLVIVAVAIWAAYSLRLGELFTDFDRTLQLFVVLPPVTVLIFAALGIYRWIVRSTNRRLFRQLVKGCIVSSFALALLILLLPPDRHNPRSLFIIYGMLVTLGTAGARFLWQELFETNDHGEPIAIYGAGSAGMQLQQLLAADRDFRPVLFIDDDPGRSGSMFGGAPIYHAGADDLGEVMNRREVSKIILAMPRLGYAEYQRKLEQLERFELPVQTIPSITEIMTGRAAISEVRDVSVEDILGRAEVPPDPELLGRCVHDKRVLVTGGGGSIGSELCRQILTIGPRRLIVLDDTEEHLYRIDEELRARCAEEGREADVFVTVLGSVTDPTVVERLFREHEIDTVYHAAAYKHVPIVERYPARGAEVNVLGTLTVVEAAARHGASHFVLVSTDKAVRPTNAMGASKRVAELVVQAKAHENRSDLVMCMVRFGNVLGSSGSVVPKFQQQIRDGGPITITHPDITRYFMTIPEAAQLVLQAGAIASDGDVFVLDMGEPVRIADLAETMVKLSGKQLVSETGDPDDIELVFEGLRPGEKMYEELFTDRCARTRIRKVLVANEYWLPWDELQESLSDLRHLVSSGENVKIRRELLRLAFLESLPAVEAQVPERHPREVSDPA